MADEPVSRILRAMLKNQNLLIPFLLDPSMTLTSAATGGLLSHFLSHQVPDLTSLTLFYFNPLQMSHKQGTTGAGS